MSESVPAMPDTPALVVEGPVASAAPVVESAPAVPVADAPPAATPDAVDASPAPAPEGVAAAAPESDKSEPEKPAFTPHTETPTGLDEIDPKPEARADEAKPAEAPKPVEAPPEAPAVNYEFEWPEGFTADPVRTEEAVGLFRKHGVAPEAAKELVSVYLAQRQQDAVDTLANQHKAFAELRREWTTQRQADPEIGGAGYETAKRIVAQGRDLLVRPDERAAFDEFQKVTGAGDHPMLWKILYRAGMLYSEPTMPSQMPRTPVPGQARNGAPRGMDAFFDRSKTNGGAFNTR